MEHADFSHIPWVVPERYRLPYVGCQSRIDIPKTLIADAIGMNFPGSGYRQKQKVELFKRIGHPGEKATCFPTLGWRCLCLGMCAPVGLRKGSGPQKGVSQQFLTVLIQFLTRESVCRASFLESVYLLLTLAATVHV
jgi:hypothetical protein